MDHDNEVIGWDYGGWTSMYLDSGECFDFGVRKSLDVVDEAFEVGDAEIGPAEYKMLGVNAGFFTNESRPFAGHGNIQYGDFFGGTRTGLSASARWRATHQLALEWRYGHNRINLPDVNGGGRIPIVAV